ncbi:hypothetical protein J7L48_03050 [bacterium]|nr:hypothetical protein [bacterium]
MNRKYGIILLISLVILGITTTYFTRTLSVKYKAGENIGSLLVGNFRVFLASFLWNRIDMYHHFWEFSGKSPNTENASLYLVKLSVAIDPHMVRAYSLGAYMLYDWNKRKNTGYSFLMEGIKNNPQSFYLWKDLYFYYLFIEKNKSKAFHTGLRALKYINKPDIVDEQYYLFLRGMIQMYYNRREYQNANKFIKILVQMNMLKSFTNKMSVKIQEVYNGKEKKQSF